MIKKLLAYCWFSCGISFLNRISASIARSTTLPISASSGHFAVSSFILLLNGLETLIPVLKQLIVTMVHSR
ncbi:hypothetical protein BDW74DRAFT_107384 [Aspergillus multicolor]|uniref:uncharacterized protein n=1 Tax=Aspergillus multicolor TaxID=41759 RepID=UPI003CCDD4AA